jgi:hypothetical protein
MDAKTRKGWLRFIGIDHKKVVWTPEEQQRIHILKAALIGNNNGLIQAAEKLWAAGYRLDPYPNGKSKGELIARIETVEAERDKTRNLLTDLLAESNKRHEKDNEDASYHGSRHDATSCLVCIRNAKAETFLAETSSVKP